MKLSKYTIPYTKDDSLFLFNTIDGSLIRLSSTIDTLGQTQTDFLKSRHFIVDDFEDESVYVKDCYKDRLTDFNKTLYLTVEITTACNFDCQFCYQSSWSNRLNISNVCIDNLIRVIAESDLSQYKALHLNIIGGEPMLFPDLVLDICNKLQILCSSRILSFSIKLNSNGYNLSAKYLSQLPSMSLMIPFLAPCDYESGLVTHHNKTNPRNVLLKRIHSWKDVMNETPEKEIIFRFNANDKNIVSFPEYVDEVCSFGFRRFSIAVVNTADCDFNHYKNQMSADTFDNWYFDTIIPILRKYNLTLPIRPRCELSRCKARRSGSFKLFADGRIGICNGIDYDNKYPLISEIRNLKDINQVFKQIKDYHYMLDDMKCHACERAFLCGGPSPCRGRICRGQIKNILRYVEAYTI